MSEKATGKCCSSNMLKRSHNNSYLHVCVCVCLTVVEHCFSLSNSVYLIGVGKRHMKEQSTDLTLSIYPSQHA